MPFDAPDTEGLIPWLLAGAAFAGWRLVQWMLGQLGWHRDREAKAADALQRDKQRLVRELTRLEASNKQALIRLRELSSDEAAPTIERLESDQLRIVNLLDTATPAEPEERI